MRTRFRTGLSAVALAAAVLSPLAVTTDAAEVTCRIPFDFVVDGTPLPAGRYLVSTSHDVLSIRGFTRGVILIGSAMDAGTATPARLVFDKYRDEYSLREVWVGGRSGRGVPLSHREQDRRRAEGNGQVERVVVVAG